MKGTGVVQMWNPFKKKKKNNVEKKNLKKKTLNEELHPAHALPALHRVSPQGCRQAERQVVHRQVFDHQLAIAVADERPQEIRTHAGKGAKGARSARVGCFGAGLVGGRGQVERALLAATGSTQRGGQHQGHNAGVAAGGA